MDADGHNTEHNGTWTKCWAEVQDGVECSVATTDPLGLCERHRTELVEGLDLTSPGSGA